MVANPVLYRVRQEADVAVEQHRGRRGIFQQSGQPHVPILFRNQCQ
jgi:hypothetical protein